jgi:hypothetical protein
MTKSTSREQQRLGRLTPVIGPFLLLAFAAGFVDHRRFWFGFLAATLLAVTLALGGLVFVLVQQATRARWAVAARRPMELLSQGLAFTFILFFVLSIAGRFVWTDWWPGAEPASALGGLWQRWFQPAAFVTRTFLYLIVLTTIAAHFARASRAQDLSGDPRISDRLQRLGWPLLLLVFVVTSAAAADWILGLHATAFAPLLAPFVALYLLTGGAAGALAALVLMGALLERHGVFGHVSSGEQRQRLAGWLAAALAGWLLVAAVLVLVVPVLSPAAAATWSGHWLDGSWRAASYVLVGGHLVALVAALVSRRRHATRGLLALAALVLVLRYLDMYQLVVPVGSAGSARPSWVDLGALGAGLSAPWLAVLLGLSEKPLYPRGDPLFEEPARPTKDD